MQNITGFGFPMLVCLCCMLCPCVGKITSPAEGENRTFLPGSTQNLSWEFDDSIASLASREWFFTKSGSSVGDKLATINEDDDPKKYNYANLSGFEIVKPATLVLENVTERYNGTYTFKVEASGPYSRNITVFIAEKPNVTLNCSNVILKEGDNFTCVCSGEDGNPPANVIWYKDDLKINGIGTKKKTLTLSNVKKTASGRYTCLAQSYNDSKYKDTKAINVQVNHKPINTTIEVPKEAYVGEKLEITCKSDGLPVPNFTITHNGTTSIVSNSLSYTKHNVQDSDAGIYTCIAKNSLGNNTDSGNLTVKEKRPSTKSAARQPTPTQPTASKTSERTTDEDSDDGLSTGAIVAIIFGVLLFVAIVVGIYCCYKKKQHNNGRDNDKRPGQERIKLN